MTPSTLLLLKICSKSNQKLVLEDLDDITPAGDFTPIHLTVKTKGAAPKQSSTVIIKQDTPTKLDIMDDYDEEDEEYEEDEDYDDEQDTTRNSNQNLK